MVISKISFFWESFDIVWFWCPCQSLYDIILRNKQLFASVPLMKTSLCLCFPFFQNQHQLLGFTDVKLTLSVTFSLCATLQDYWFPLGINSHTSQWSSLHVQVISCHMQSAAAISNCNTYFAILSYNVATWSPDQCQHCSCCCVSH